MHPSTLSCIHPHYMHSLDIYVMCFMVVTYTLHRKYVRQVVYGMDVRDVLAYILPLCFVCMPVMNWCMEHICMFTDVHFYVCFLIVTLDHYWCLCWGAPSRNHPFLCMGRVLIILGQPVDLPVSLLQGYDKSKLSAEAGLDGFMVHSGEECLTLWCFVVVNSEWWFIVIYSGL